MNTDLCLQAKMYSRDESGEKLAQPQSQLKQQQQQLVFSNNAIANINISGFSSFDSDSIADCSEFDTESVTMDYFKERYL